MAQDKSPIALTDHELQAEADALARRIISGFTMPARDSMLVIELANRLNHHTPTITKEPTMPAIPSPTAEALLQAQLKLGAAQSGLEAANACATAVEAMLLAPLIRQASEMRDRIASIRMAMRDDATEAQRAAA